MTFGVRTFQGVPQGSVTFVSAAAYDLKGPTLPVSASVTFNTDGSMSNTGNASSTPAGWWSSIGGTPGNTVWVKFTAAGGSAWNTGGLVAGTVYQLSSARSIGWSAVAHNASIGTATVTFYSDAAGTQVIGSGTIDGDVESS